MKLILPLVSVLCGLLAVQSCQPPTSPAPAITTYSVTYYANGATGTPPTDGATYPQGAIVTTKGSGSLSKAGYSFNGWNTLSNGSGVAYAAGAQFTMGTSRVDLFAQWTASQNTISFNANGGVGSMASQTVATNATANLTANTFTRTGYAFAGWNTLANGTGTEYADMASYTMGTASVTLYAQWNLTYAVTYFDNGSSSGSVPVDNKNYQAGATVTVLGNTGNLAKTGYSFTGWNTLPDGSGTSYGSGSAFSMPASNTNLYALWTNSTTGTVSIESPPTYVVTISGSSTISVGIAATFSSTYTGNAVAYQWYLNGTAIPGATTSSLTYTQAAATAYYGINQLLLVVIDVNGLWYSSDLPITVTN